MTLKKAKLLAIVGPTTSGKTELARRLALQYNGEVVSADSRQIYKGMDIGTAKDKTFPQWLIDIVEPTQSFTVTEYQKAAYSAIDDIHRRGKLPILCGGTGLYVSAILEGYQFSPQERSSLNPRHSAGINHQKSAPNWDKLEIGIDLPRAELYQRIDERVISRLDDGMINEAQQLVASGLTLDRLRRFGLEYRFLADLLEEKIDREQFVIQLQGAIHQYARRQLTWFRHHGNVHWIHSASEAEQLVADWLAE